MRIKLPLCILSFFLLSALAMGKEDFITASEAFDLNSNGHTDIVLGFGEGHERDGVLWGGPNGFLFKSSLPKKGFGEAGVTTTLLALDFNKDGLADILSISSTKPHLGRYESSSIQLFLQGPNHNFEEAQVDFNNPQTIWPESVKIADFNGDGWPDFLLTSSGACEGLSCSSNHNNIGAIFLNKEGQSLVRANIKLIDSQGEYSSNQLKYDYSLGLSGQGNRIWSFLLDAVVGDFNKDGRVDVFSPNQSSTHVFYMGRSSSFNELKFQVRVVPRKVSSCVDFGSCIDFLKTAWGAFVSDDPTRGAYFVSRKKASERKDFQRMCNGVLGCFVKPNAMDQKHYHLSELLDSSREESTFLMTSPPTLKENHGEVILWSFNRKGEFKELQNLKNILTHPRELIVKKGDNQTMVFIADHGADTPPFSGAYDLAFEYKEKALFKIANKQLEKKDFTHGASMFFEHGKFWVFKNLKYDEFEEGKTYQRDELLIELN